MSLSTIFNVDKGKVRGNQKISMQNLSEIFDLFRFKTSIYNNAKFCGQWEVTEHSIGQTCFHMPTEGECILRVDGENDVKLNQGDLVIFPYEIEHSLCSLVTNGEEFTKVDYPVATEVDGVGMLCGTIAFEHTGTTNILDQLPRYFVVRNNGDAPWLSAMLELIVVESYQTNTSVVLNRLSEILFINALKHYIENSDQTFGFLSLYANKRLSKSVQAIHQSPEINWDLEQLASLSNMSRTSFINHFRNSSGGPNNGWTVMQYLTWWRMQLAYDYLKKGETVDSVAAKVGYQSTAALSRAFKRQFGVNVGQVRRLKISKLE